jgi:Zn-finger nucleic acid-binding protein
VERTVRIAHEESRREPERMRYEERVRDRDDDRDDDERRYGTQRKKRSSWLSEIFELGGGGD